MSNTKPSPCPTCGRTDKHTMPCRPQGPAQEMFLAQDAITTPPATDEVERLREHNKLQQQALHELHARMKTKDFEIGQLTMDLADVKKQRDALRQRWDEAKAQLAEAATYSKRLEELRLEDLNEALEVRRRLVRVENVLEEIRMVAGGGIVSELATKALEGGE